MDCSTPGFPVLHHLLELAQTHICWVSDAIQPSCPLSSASPPACSLSQHQGLFKWVSSSHQVAKILEFQLQHQSFQWTPRTEACPAASLSITNSWSSLRFMSFESVMQSELALLLLSVFPTIMVFLVSQFFATGGQSIGASASASILPMSIQDWFPLGWNGWISLQSKGLLRVFTNTTVQKHQFFGIQLSL